MTGCIYMAKVIMTIEKIFFLCLLLLKILILFLEEISYDF